MPPPLRGIFPPIPTIFDARTGDVDTEGIAANVAWMMSAGLAGALALGSNGEAGLLDDEESDAVVAATRRAVPSDRVLLVGVGRESTRATIAAAARAASLGADAVLVRPPSYYRAHVTPEALVAHFEQVADGSPVPVVLYNLPGPTGVTLTMPVVAALAKHGNVAGLKETSPELERLSQFATLRGGTFPVLSGWAPVLYPAMMAGAAGGILAVANVRPDLCVALYEHAREGRHADALALQRSLTPLAQLVSSVHGIAGLKTAMDLVGRRGGPVRPPLGPISDRGRDDIARALQALPHPRAS